MKTVNDSQNASQKRYFAGKNLQHKRVVGFLMLFFIFLKSLWKKRQLHVSFTNLLTIFRLVWINWILHQFCRTCLVLRMDLHVMRFFNHHLPFPWCPKHFGILRFISVPDWQQSFREWFWVMWKCIVAFTFDRRNLTSPEGR